MRSARGQLAASESPTVAAFGRVDGCRLIAKAAEASSIPVLSCPLLFCSGPAVVRAARPGESMHEKRTILRLPGEPETTQRGAQALLALCRALASLAGFYRAVGGGGGAAAAV